MIDARSIGLLGVVVALALAAPLQAQRGPQGRRGEMDRTRLEQRVRAQMGRMIQERLGLTDEQSARLSEVVRVHEAQRLELRRTEQATRRRVEALLLEGGEDQIEARELLTRMAELRAREAELFREEQEALLEVISASQILQMQAIREQIGQRIRALRGPRGEPAGGMRRRGGASPQREPADALGSRLPPVFGERGELIAPP
jgi:Spy/CpxP family protein refolding chaperone